MIVVLAEVVELDNSVVAGTEVEVVLNVVVVLVVSVVVLEMVVEVEVVFVLVSVVISVDVVVVDVEMVVVDASVHDGETTEVESLSQKVLNLVLQAL